MAQEINNTLTIEVRDFPTHIPMSSKTWVKVNVNNVYGAVNYHVRDKLVRHLKAFLKGQIPKSVYFTKFPLKVYMEMHLPINYGTVRRRKTDGKIMWNPPTKDYVVNWDYDNIVDAWYKTLQDSLTSSGIIPNDTVSHIDEKHQKYIPCKTLEERKIVIKLIPKTDGI